MKLLIIHPGALGDVICSFPAILLLRDRFDRIDLISRHEIGKLACCLRLIENSYPLESAVFAGLFSTADDHCDTRLFEILNLYDKILFFGFSGIISENIQKITGKRPCRVSPRPLPDKCIHVSRHLVLRLVESDLLTKGSENRMINVFKNYRCKEFDPQKITIHPGSGSPRKNWPVQNFLKVAGILKSDGFRPVFVMGPAEKSLAAKIEKGWYGIISSKLPDAQEILFFPNDLMELADVLKNSAAYIGNDSGVSHLAAFLGIPTISIFGPTDPRRWMPLGLHSGAVFVENSCKPCFENTNAVCEKRDCLTKISPEQVMKNFLL